MDLLQSEFFIQNQSLKQRALKAIGDGDISALTILLDENRFDDDPDGSNPFVIAAAYAKQVACLVLLYQQGYSFKKAPIDPETFRILENCQTMMALNIRNQVQKPATTGGWGGTRHPA